MKPAYHQGDKVICNGYLGTLIRQYSENMYEVRLNAGLVCVDVSAIKPITKDIKP